MIAPLIKVKANIILVTCGLLILMIHMALNQHQSGGRCDRLLQVTLTARFSIDPLSLYPHIHYTIHIHYIQNIFISTSKSFFSLPLYPHTSSTSKTSSSQHLLPLLHWIQCSAILWLSTIFWVGAAKDKLVLKKKKFFQTNKRTVKKWKEVQYVLA